MLRANINNLTYSEGGTAVIKEARLNVEIGSIICISGKNGVGKTTLLNCICGIIPKIIRAYGSIEVSIDGNNDYAKNMIYVSQYTENSLFFFDVKSQLIHMGYEKMKEVLEKYSLEDMINAKIQTLSSGQKKLISLIGALYTNKKVCIFDEPTTFLDNENIDKLFEQIKEVSHEKIILIVSHDNKCMKFADLNYEIINGKLEEIKRPILIPLQINSKYKKKESWFETNEISFVYPNGHKVFINQKISMSQDEILGLIGKNGSGKTTVMNYFFQQHRKDIISKGMLQDFRKQFFSYSVQGEVELILGKKSKNKTMSFLQRLGLYEIRDENPNFISDGQKRLLLMGLLFLDRGDILFLDEPFDNLDEINRRIALELIKDFKSNYRTIVLMDQSLANICDVVERVIYI